MKPRGSLARYREAASNHLDWCEQNGISRVGGRWDLEDPISGLLLAAFVDVRSAPVLLRVLCGKPDWVDVVVDDVWWPSAYVDVIVNFRVSGVRHMLLVEHKQLNSPSNMPGWRKKKRDGLPIYWQTEAALLEVDRVRILNESELLGGPFVTDAIGHAVLLDARGRTMEEAFELYAWLPPHRHDRWTTMSYEDFCLGIRGAYDQTQTDALVPLLGQLFASERE